MKDNKNRPIVMIIGRPNVGKSTLFNRLCGKRLAITDSQPGATRDVIEHEAIVEGQSILLWDSAGCRPDTQDDLETLAGQHTMHSMQQAYLILLVVEGHALVPEDYFLIDQLRKVANKVVLVANKCDSPEKDEVLPDLYRLGFGQPLCISAEHNRNMAMLRQLIAQRLPQKKVHDPDHDEIPQQHALKIAVAGRPNAGKSSLANALSGMQRSLVSDIAGTTRDTVHSMFSYQDQLVEILDTAGLRRATKVKERLEYYASTRTEQAIAESDIVYLVIDITQGLTEQDKKIADKIAESQKACLFVLNKCDLKPQKNKSRQGADLSQEMYKDDIAKVRQDFPVLAYAPMVAVSCYQPHTLEQLLQSTFKLHKQNGRKVDEHELVRALKEWVVARPPARRGNRPPLLRSLRQVGQYPPRFVLKVYGEVDDNYVRYLTNNVRKEFGFARVPLYVEVVHGS